MISAHLPPALPTTPIRLKRLSLPPLTRGGLAKTRDGSHRGYSKRAYRAGCPLYCGEQVLLSFKIIVMASSGAQSFEGKPEPRFFLLRSLVVYEAPRIVALNECS